MTAAPCVAVGLGVGAGVGVNGVGATDGSLGRTTDSAGAVVHRTEGLREQYAHQSGTGPDHGQRGHRRGQAGAAAAGRLDRKGHDGGGGRAR